MTCPGTLRPSAPQRQGRPMNSTSSNCPTARAPQVARAPANSAVCVQALAASSMTWTAITRAEIRRPAKACTWLLYTSDAADDM
eukprot:2452762-Alexandrium_andersonii.AAC.1